MEPILGQAGSQAGAASITDGSDATFREDVIDASMSVPVVVDFWAPWCGPCKQLGPAIEKVITNAGGKAKLVKINIDENPAIAGQLRVQSIPAVFGFVGGRPVDGFAGALPESQIKEFVNRLIQMGGGEAGEDPVEQAMEQATAATEAGDHATAAAIYAQVVQHDPEQVQALAKLAQAYIKLEELEAAREVLAGVPADKASDADVASARSALELAEKAGEAAARLGELEATLAANPNDHQARFDLADAQAAMGRSEEAIDNLLHIIQVERGWNDDAARLHLLKVFEALGPTDEAVLSGRRRLSSLLFS
ncbi:MAG: co-chaperone YbbN [Alphaproteobacteria bacterium]